MSKLDLNKYNPLPCFPSVNPAEGEAGLYVLIETKRSRKNSEYHSARQPE